MKTPKEIAQHYIRYYCPEYNELTCCEIYQLKYRENDSDFLNKVSEILKPKFFSSISIEDIYEYLFFIDIAEFFDHNQELLKYDFIDKHSFGKNQQVYSKNKMKMSLGHYNITPFNPIYNVYIDFILDKDKLVSNENALTLLCNDDILIYNKYNLEKSLLIYIEAIKKRYLRSSIIFSYLTSFLRSTTDLTDFFYISSGCEKGNYTTTIREIESHCPIGEDGFFDKQNFITIKKEQSFICIYNQFDKLLLKKDSRLISKNNFNIEFIIPLKKIISDLDNLRASNFFTIRKENLEKNILNSIKKEKIECLNIEILEPQIKCEFLDKLIYSYPPYIKIFFELLKETILLEPTEDRNYYYYEEDFIEKYNINYELLIVSQEKGDLTNLLSGYNKTGSKKRI